MSSQTIVVIRFDGEDLVFLPGETLSGQYWINGFDSGEIKSIEASVLWHTEGKGDEDMAVHEFWRRDADETHPIDPSEPMRFQTILPDSPLSYEGQIIKLRWCVRVRAFPSRGRELLGEKAFQLGDVASVKARSS